MNFEKQIEIKTLEGWEKFAEENNEGGWDEYCKRGDLVDEGVYEYFLEILPPVVCTVDYLQVGEAKEHRINPATGKCQGVYATFARVSTGIWRYCGNCFAGGILDVEESGEVNTLQAFMKATYCVNFGVQVTRPRIICSDGFSMSVQAGECLYCSPRKNLESGRYEAYEIGFPSETEELLKQFAEDDHNYTDTVYAWVPSEVVEQVIEKHGGMKMY